MTGADGVRVRVKSSARYLYPSNPNLAAAATAAKGRGSAAATGAAATGGSAARWVRARVGLGDRLSGFGFYS